MAKSTVPFRIATYGSSPEIADREIEKYEQTLIGILNERGLSPDVSNHQDFYLVRYRAHPTARDNLDVLDITFKSGDGWEEAESKTNELIAPDQKEFYFNQFFRKRIYQLDHKQHYVTRGRVSGPETLTTALMRRENQTGPSILT